MELEQPFLHDLLRVGLNESCAEEVHDGVDQAMLPRSCLALLRAVARCLRRIGLELELQILQTARPERETELTLIGSGCIAIRLLIH